MVTALTLTEQEVVLVSDPEITVNEAVFAPELPNVLVQFWLVAEQSSLQA